MMMACLAVSVNQTSDFEMKYVTTRPVPGSAQDLPQRNRLRPSGENITRVFCSFAVPRLTAHNGQ